MDEFEIKMKIDDLERRVSQLEHPSFGSNSDHKVDDLERKVDNLENQTNNFKYELDEIKRNSNNSTY